MRRHAALLALLLGGTLGGAAALAQGGPALDGARIERLTGLKGRLDQKEGVFKVSAPRTDLRVMVAGVKMTPPMGLTSWAAFTRAGAHTAVMGDIVLTEDQVNINVVAIHNHMTGETPRVLFLRYWGVGRTIDLARGLKTALGQTATH
ncbi:MAG TPA: DUF1259 domain-containing protein [Polyangia bacterium]|jgi:hypothetical protein